MTLDQLSAWAAKGESETQEFKLTTGQRSEAAKTICAMLNHRGGRVIFGVDAKGRIIGQAVTDKTVDDISQELRQLDPPALPAIERIPTASGNEALIVTVEKGARRPYTFRGKAYRRVGASNQELDRDEYNRLLLEQLHGVSRWENQEAEGWTVKDLDETEIVRTLEEAVRRGRAEDPGTRDPQDILRGLKLAKDGALFRAAIMLFGREQRLALDYPQCQLRLARFRGTDKTEFLDNRKFNGNVFELLLRAERFIRDHIPVAGRIVPNLFEREDDPLYPPLALREALANAFCHRDYSIGGGSVGVAIFDDRLEISSSGELHFGLKAADLYQPHESLPWNPLIADVLFRRGIIETWGRGTLKMAELAERAGLPRPEIETIPGAVVVRFRPSRYLPPQKVGHDLSARQRMVLSLLAEEPMRLAAIFSRMEDGVSLRNLRVDLDLLRKLGLVDSRGHGRGARWHLK